MKYQKHGITDKNSKSFSYKLSLIFWAVINNNMISTLIYLIFKVIEFIIFSLLVLCIYGETHSVSFSTFLIEEYFELHQYEKLNYISELIVISYMGLMLFIIILLLSTQQAMGYYQQKTLFLKSLSIMINMFRAILNSLIAIIFSLNFMDYDPQSFSIKLVQLLCISFMAVFTIILVLIVSNFSLLRIPNQVQPWSEQSTQPFIMEFMFKIFLSMAFNFRFETVLRNAFLVLANLTIIYKIYLRITFSQIFKEIVHKTELMLDSVLLNYIFLILFSEPFKDKDYITKATIIAPIWLLIVWYTDYYYQRQTLTKNIDDLKTDNQKLFALTKLLKAYVKNKPQDQNTLSQIKFSHYFKCHSFAENLERHIIKSIKSRETQAIKEEVKDNYDPISYNGITINFQEEEEKKAENAGSSQFETRFSAFQSLSQYQPSHSYNTEENLKQISSIDYVERYIKKKKQSQNYINAKTKKTNISNNPISIFSLQTQENTLAQEKQQLEDNLKKKRFKSVIKHFFKYHMIDDQSKDLRLFLLHIYFTMKILENHYLAHFLVFGLQQLIKKENPIQQCLIMIHINHFHLKINQKVERNNQYNNVNLNNVLGLSQLMAKFEECLDLVAETISHFWQSFIHNKQEKTLYQQGLKISQQIDTIQDTYEEIEKLQGEQKEIKVYVLMSAFYKYVVFKTNEYILEINKSKMIWQTKKIAFQAQGKVNDTEKGLLIAKMDLKKPMKIEFTNKFFAKLISWNSKELINQKINAIMPQLIGENHHKFVSRFLETGKHKMINQSKENFLRNKQGFIIPITTYLNISNLSQQSLILIIEENHEFRVFEKDTEYIQSEISESLILADKTFKIYEMNYTAQNALKISPDLIEAFQQGTGFQPKLDDFFITTNSNVDLEIQHENGISEFEITVKQGNQQNLELITANESRKLDSLNQQSMPQFTRAINNIFYMKIMTVHYCDSQVEMKIIAIKPQQSIYQVRQGSDQFSKMVECIKIEQSIEQQNYDKTEDKKSTGDAGFQNLFAQLSHDGSFDISSQGSSTSSSSNSLNSKYSQYSQSLKSRSMPRTLKFVLYIVVLAFLLIIATSTVSLTLTMSNFNDAIKGIKISYESFQRLNALTQTRLQIRILYNIANGYVKNKSELLDDRFLYYAQAAKDNVEVIRQHQILLAQADKEVQNSGGYINLEYLAHDNTIEYETRLSNEAVNIYVTYGDDLTTQALKNGQQILRSQLSYFVVSNEDIKQASLIERTGFFLIENANQDFYHEFILNTFDYTKSKKETMSVKINFSSGMTWVCIAIIFICGLIVIPLSGRIQNRILVLMTIFFEIKVDLKKQMITEINKFKDVLKPDFKAVQKQNEKKQSGVYVQSMEYQKQHESTLTFNKVKNRMKNSDKEKIKALKNVDDKIGKMKKFEISPIIMKSNQKLNKGSNFKKQDSPEKEEEKESDDEIQIDNHQQPQKSLEELKSDQEQQSISRQEGNITLLRYFVLQIQRAKIKQSIIIMIITLAFNSYFLGSYFQVYQDFETLLQGLDIIHIILLRKACVENVIHSIQEQLVANQTYLVSDNDNNLKNITDYYIDYCYSVETLFQEKIISEQPDFLQDVFDQLEQLEEGQFCQIFDDHATNRINSTQCSQYGEGMALIGANGVYQSIYKQVNQIKLDYDFAFHSGLISNTTYITSLMDKLSDYIDAILIIFDFPDQMVCNQSSNSLMDYFNQQYLMIILIFSIFIAVTLIFMLFFLFSKTQFELQFLFRYFQETQKRNAIIQPFIDDH